MMIKIKSSKHFNNKNKANLNATGSHFVTPKTIEMKHLKLTTIRILTNKRMGL